MPDDNVRVEVVPEVTITAVGGVDQGGDYRALQVDRAGAIQVHVVAVQGIPTWLIVSLLLFSAARAVIDLVEVVTDRVQRWRA